MNFLKSDNYLGSFSQLWILPLQHYKGIGYNAATGYFAKGLKNYLIPLPFSMDTAEWKVKRKKGIYTVAVQCFFKGADEATLSQLAQLENSPFLVVIKDHNNSYVIMGDNANFFLFDHNFESGKDFSDVAGTEIKLERDMIIPPIFITTPFVNSPPLAKAVGIIGNKNIGQIVTGTYSFYDDDNDSEASHQFKWYLADNDMGVNPIIISGETDQTLTIDAAWLGMYILFSVVVSDGIDSSAETFSPAYVILSAENKSPQALSVTITGEIKSGKTVNGTYTYYDEENDQEHESIFAWYISDNSSGSPKTKLPSSTTQCTIDNQSGGKYLQFSVIPINALGIGRESFSQPSLIESAMVEVTSDFRLAFAYNTSGSFDQETKVFSVNTINEEAPNHYFRVQTTAPLPLLPPMKRLYFSFKFMTSGTDHCFGIGQVWAAKNPSYSNGGGTITGAIVINQAIPVVDEWVEISGYLSSNMPFDGFCVRDSGDIHHPNNWPFPTALLPFGVITKFKDLVMSYEA